MQQLDTQTQATEAFQTGVDFDTYLKAAIDAYVDVVDCMDRIRALQELIALRQSGDRTSLDLVG